MLTKTHTSDLRLIKARVLMNLPQRAPGGPSRTVSITSILQRSLARCTHQFFRSELMHMGLQWNVVAWVGSVEVGVGARVQGARVNKFRAEIGGKSLGEGGFYQPEVARTKTGPNSSSWAKHATSMGGSTSPMNLLKCRNPNLDPTISTFYPPRICQSRAPNLYPSW